MTPPQPHTTRALPAPEHAAPAGLAVAHDHPLVIAAWIAVGLAVAVGLGPWLSRCAGVVLPAFALVRTRG